MDYLCSEFVLPLAASPQMGRVPGAGPTMLI